MPSQLTLGVILALLLSTAGLGWYAKYQTERAAVAQAAVADAQAAGEAWQLALSKETKRANEQADKLAQSTRGYESLRRITDKRMQAYETADRSDIGTADWGNVRVPAFISDRVCEYPHENTSKSGLPTDAKTVYRPDPNPCPGANRYYTNRDLWRWTERLIEGWERFNADREALK